MSFDAKNGPIILIVDDEKFMRELIKRMLDTIGYRNTIMADTGEKAIEIVRDNTDIIECVLLDIELPDMDGIAFLELLRSEPEDRRPDMPVVMVTGHSDRKNVTRALELGVSHFLTKPLAANDLKKAITMALRGFVIDPGKI